MESPAAPRASPPLGSFWPRLMAWLRQPAGSMAVMLVLIAVGTALARIPGIAALDLALLDLEFALLARYAPLPADDGIVIVGIDEATLDALPEPIALSHRLLGRAFSALAAGGPRAVGVDVVLPDRSFDAFAPGADQALVTGLLRLARVAPVVLGVTTTADGRVRPIHAPFLAAARSTGDDYALLPTDVDGQVRRYFDRLGEHGEAVSTLVGRMTALAGVEPKPGLVQYALGNGFDYLPMHDLLAMDARGDTAALQSAVGGRRVLIGVLLPHEDRKRQPVALARWEPAREVPGVVVHAQMLRTQLAGAAVRPVPLLGQGMLLALAASLWFVRTWRWRIAALLGFGLASFAGALALLRMGLELPLGSAWRTAIAAAVITSTAEAWRVRLDRARLRRVFGGYVSPGVLRDILRGALDVNTVARRGDFCFLFADLRGFTSLSERLSPEHVVALLNRYYAAMTPVVHAHGGTIDNFRGDGLMAVFGAPNTLASPVSSGVRAARAMIGRLATLNTELAREGEAPLAMGVSLACGDAIVGNVGSPERYNYTAIGDGANVAARLQEVARTSGYPVVADAAMVAHAEPDAAQGWVPLGETAIRGHAPVRVVGWQPEAAASVPMTWTDGVPPTPSRAA